MFWLARLGRPVGSPLNVEGGRFLKEYRDALPGKGEKGLGGESQSCSHTGPLGGAPTGELGQRKQPGGACGPCVRIFSGKQTEGPSWTLGEGGGCSGSTTCQPRVETLPRGFGDTVGGSERESGAPG